jgi:autotransporter translocation and assembly factor TamB
MARVTRLLLRVALAAVALAVVLALAAGVSVYALSRGWQRESLRALAERETQAGLANAGYDATIRIGALEGTLLGQATLRDVELSFGNAAVVRAARVDGAFELRPLWESRTLVVTALRVSGAELSAARWPERAREPTPGRELAVELRELALAPAAVELRVTRGGHEDRLAGTLQGDGRGLVFPHAGGFAWPTRANASLELAAGVLAGRELRSARLTFALDGSQLRVSDGALEADFGNAKLSGETDLAGWLDPDAPAAVTLELEAEKLDLALLLDRPELAGAFSGSASARAVHAPGARLADASGDVRATLSASRLGRLRIDAGALEAHADAGKWRIERASLRSSAARLEARGAGERGRIDSLDASLEVSDLAPLARVFGADAAGRLSARVTLAGEWRSAQGKVELTSSGLRIGDLPIGAISARGVTRGAERIQIDPLRIDGPRLRLAADGPVALRRAGGGVDIERARLRFSDSELVSLAGRVEPSRVTGLRIELDGISAARLGRALGVAPELGGRVSGTLSAEGPLPRPALRGELAWTGSAIGQVEAERVSAALETSGGMLRATGGVRARGRELLQASFATPWTPAAPLAGLLARPETQLALRGDSLEPSLAEELLPGTLTGVSGSARVRVELRGGAPEPTLDGELELRDVAFELTPLGKRFGPLDARLRLDKDAVHVEQLELREGSSGVARVTGDVLLADLQPAGADLRLELVDFPVRWQTALEARANGSASVVGALDSLAASGALELRGMHFSLGGGSDPLLGEIAVPEPNAPRQRTRSPSPFDSLYQRASVDLQIEVPEHSHVSGLGAEVEIHGALRAAKSSGRPLVLYGAIDTDGGSYRLRGKAFAIEQGRVEFTGRPDLDPELDVRAMHRVRDVKIYASVSGRASLPVVRLTSDPPYPEDDLLALLLFNRTRDELGSQQAGVVQGVLAEAAGGLALERLRGAIGIDLPIDTLEVGTSERDGGQTLGVGGYVTQNVFIRYGQGMGPDAKSDVRVDWKFAPHWSVESSVSTRGDSSADLIWSYDY